jgi:mRNA interferase MazF
LGSGLSNTVRFSETGPEQRDETSWQAQRATNERRRSGVAAETPIDGHEGVMSDLAEPRKGEIWIADLDKRRPVVVLTRDPLGSLLQSVLVAPITSRARMLSTEVAIGSADGINLDSVASFDNMQRISRAKLCNRVGVVSTSTAEHICVAIAIATGCDDHSQYE